MIIIPDGSSKPVRIPKQCQIDINEQPTGTQGSIVIQSSEPPLTINYPLTAHPYPKVFNLANPDCNITNRAVKNTPPGSSVDINTLVLPTTEA